MTAWTGERVGRVLGAAPVPGLSFTAVATDTRTLPPNALFVALRGQRFDGHDYLREARARGALGAVVRRGTPAVPGLAAFEVEDTLAALGLLARERRREVPGPVVAVTGTNGKTSTKEMLAAALATRWRVHATRANENNLVGVPLTILSAPPETEALVVEAGANQPGEIARLREVIAPTLAVITNVSAGHLEGFGSVEAALAEKVSLLEGVPVAIVGTRPGTLANAAAQRAKRVVVAGLEPPARVRPRGWRMGADGHPQLALGGRHVTLPLPGAHQAENAVVAWAAAVELGVDGDAAATALEGVVAVPGRCRVLRRGALIVLDDTYNANPASVEAALATADAIRGDRALVVVLGTMLELGPESAALHARAADAAMARRPALVGAMGAFIPAFRRHAAALVNRLLEAEEADMLGRLVASRLRGDELVVVKASHGVHLERALVHLIPDRERPCSTIS